MTNTPLNLTAQFRRRALRCPRGGAGDIFARHCRRGIRLPWLRFFTAGKEPSKRSRGASPRCGAKLDEQLHSAVESASKDLVEAEAALANFATQHFKQWPAMLERASNSHEVRNPPAALANNPHETQPPPMMANPRWQELRDQLDKLKQRRSELLETFLPAHPAIQAINTSIDALETRLSAVPQQVPAPEPIVPGSKPSEPPKVATQAMPESPIAADFAAQWQAEEAEYQKLAKRAERAQQQYCDAVKQETAALKSCAEVLDKPVAAVNFQKPTGQANPKGGDSLVRNSFAHFGNGVRMECEICRGGISFSGRGKATVGPIGPGTIVFIARTNAARTSGCGIAVDWSSCDDLGVAAGCHDRMLSCHGGHRSTILARAPGKPPVCLFAKMVVLASVVGCRRG